MVALTRTCVQFAAQIIEPLPFKSNGVLVLGMHVFVTPGRALVRLTTDDFVVWANEDLMN